MSQPWWKRTVFPDKYHRYISLAAASVIGFVYLAQLFLGSYWPVELATHFPLQQSLGLLAFLALFLVFRHWYASTVTAVVFLLSVFVLLFGASPGKQPEISKSKPDDIRGVLFNTSSDRLALKDLLKSEPARDRDIVFVVEATADFTLLFDDWADTYPHQHAETRFDNFGMAVLSKQSIEVERNNPSAVPWFRINVKHKGGTVGLNLIHVLPPVSARKFNLRNFQLDLIRKRFVDSNRADIVLGDFNVSPWSPYFEKLLEGTGWTRAGAGDLTYYTWPAGRPYLYTAIDHVLYNPEVVQVPSYRIGTNHGSDHYPVYFSFRSRLTNSTN